LLGVGGAGPYLTAGDSSFAFSANLSVLAGGADFTARITQDVAYTLAASLPAAALYVGKRYRDTPSGLVVAGLYARYRGDTYQYPVVGGCGISLCGYETLMRPDFGLWSAFVVRVPPGAQPGIVGFVQLGLDLTTLAPIAGVTLGLGG
jgi:hypothetical protein